MDYGRAQQKGEPLGSGAMESTCRQYQCRFSALGNSGTRAAMRLCCVRKPFDAMGAGICYSRIPLRPLQKLTCARPPICLI